MTNPSSADDWTRGPGPDAMFSQFLAQQAFRIQRRRGCATHLFYPRLACSRCGGVELEWVVPSGRGVVHAVSVVNRSSARWPGPRR